MAEIRKYLDTTALGTLVDQIKAEDSKVLAAAKKYTDEASYDAAGSAATAKSEAIADADAKFAVVNENIAKKADASALEAEVTRATGKEAELLAAIEATDAIADKNKEDIVAINDGTNGILAQAKGYTDGQIEAVQGDVDELTEYVGTFTHDTAKTVVEYINSKTDGIATSGNLEALAGRVTAVEGDVTTIKGDYLKGSDKTELEGKIGTAQAAAEGAQSTADTAKAAIDAFLKEADATESAIDTLKEIQAELEIGGGAAAMLAEINALKAVDNATQAELDAALVTVNENIGKKADQTTVDGIDGRLAAVEAIDVATKAYADQAETDAVNAAKSYADGIDTALKARLDALELIDHDHANKAELDLIASGDKAKWDSAEAKAHEHGNKAVLDGITSAKVEAWDAAEGNAKTYADGLNTTMTGKVDGIDGRVGTLESTITGKADASALADAVADIADNAEAIAANTSAINSFTAITSDEVNALFA